jgi:hypothetical protein
MWNPGASFDREASSRSSLSLELNNVESPQQLSMRSGVWTVSDFFLSGVFIASKLNFIM